MKLAINEYGFTLVELTLSMAIFCLMLLIVSKGFVGVVHIQQAGVGSRNTQQNARLVMEQIVRDGRSAQDVRVLGSVPNQLICLVTAGGLSEYYVKADKRLYKGTVDYNSGFDRVTNTCVSGASFTSESALTSTDVAVVDLEGTVMPTPPAFGPPLTPPSLSLKMKVATSNHPTNTVCTPGGGSQFCSVSELSSTVSLRGTQ